MTASDEWYKQLSEAAAKVDKAWDIRVNAYDIDALHFKPGEFEEALGEVRRLLWAKPPAEDVIVTTPTRIRDALITSDLMRRYQEYADLLPTMRPHPLGDLADEWSKAIVSALREGNDNRSSE